VELDSFPPLVQTNVLNALEINHNLQKQVMILVAVGIITTKTSFFIIATTFLMRKV
jgi:hypothetical protein